MTTPAAHADLTAPSGLLKAVVDEEPALAGAAATWLLASGGDLLVHYHLVGPVQWSSETQVLLTPVAGVVLGVIGWLVRSVVASPKTQRLLQAALDDARANAATAVTNLATASRPVIVQLDGKVVAATAPDPNRAAEQLPTALDGLPAIQAPPAGNLITDDPPSAVGAP